MGDFESDRMEILSKFCLEDRIAVITGAGGLIGRGIALAFAGVGAHIVVAELNDSRGEAAAEKIRALGRKALPISLDVTNSDQVQSMVDRVLAEFGRIDILVNNVGGKTGKDIPMLEMPNDTWDSVIHINLKSTFLCSKIVGRVMRDQKRGNIINIASGTGERPYPDMVAYAAAKAGIINFTQSLAVYLAPHNIRVNCIAPGRIVAPSPANVGSDQQLAERGGVLLRRYGYPEDVAFAAIYLASEAADYLTGAVIDVTGGPHLGGIMQKQAEELWKSQGSQH